MEFRLYLIDSKRKIGRAVKAFCWHAYGNRPLRTIDRVLSKFVSCIGAKLEVGTVRNSDRVVNSGQDDAWPLGFRDKLKSRYHLLDTRSPMKEMLRSFSAARLSFLPARSSYCQERENLVVQSYFRSNTNWFCVDVRAHHGFRISNTSQLDQNGWSGVNAGSLLRSRSTFLGSRPRNIKTSLVISRFASAERSCFFEAPK